MDFSPTAPVMDADGTPRPVRPHDRCALHVREPCPQCPESCRPLAVTGSSERLVYVSTSEDAIVKGIIRRVQSVDISHDNDDQLQDYSGISRTKELNSPWAIYWGPGNELNLDGNLVGPMWWPEPTTFGFTDGDFLAALNETLSGGDSHFEFDGIDMQEALRLIAATELGAPVSGHLYVNGGYAEWEGREVTYYEEPEGSS